MKPFVVTSFFSRSCCGQSCVIPAHCRRNQNLVVHMLIILFAVCFLFPFSFPSESTFFQRPTHHLAGYDCQAERICGRWPHTTPDWGGGGGGSRSCSSGRRRPRRQQDCGADEARDGVYLLHHQRPRVHSPHGAHLCALNVNNGSSPSLAAGRQSHIQCL